ncbi:GlxA family transcriptional regulator [Rodentibacter myodis]|uniref:AraC family transcriptional regulator n=1 Tax=Rodentibacter myodis TaxID=1907939 RepID=A0A1V3JFX1_9PAST|nr:helix-turn-helix domain-containing protein [Rodentibacter myodis]OOF55626.1 AraC family transcriptional regulator [Rodentibacter myodis]
MPTVALIVYDHIMPIHFSMAYSVFSLKDEQNQPLFSVKVVSDNPDNFQHPLLHIQLDGGLDCLHDADMVVMTGWHDTAIQPSERLLDALRQAYERGATVVGLCYGSYVLACAGLLNGKKATSHWLGEQEFTHRFPTVKWDFNPIYLQDDRIITSAGLVASLDCCLSIVRNIYGVKIANHIARLLVIPPHREGGQAQFIEQPIARATSNRNINTLLAYLSENLTALHQIDDLAHRLSMSRSSFTRHFRKATGMSVNQWLIEARLQRARDLLESSRLSITEIALQSGFNSDIAFRQHFMKKHKVAPNQWRKRFSE